MLKLGCITNCGNPQPQRLFDNNTGATNFYIQKIILNGKPYQKNFIIHNDIVAGSVIEFFMGKTPNKKMANYEKPPTTVE